MNVSSALSNVRDNVTYAMYSAKGTLVRHAPQLLFAAGVVGIGAVGILGYHCGCKAVAHYRQYKEDIDRRADEIVGAQEDRVKNGESVIIDRDDAQWCGKRTVKLVADITKDLLPVIIVGGLTIAAFATGQHIIAVRLASVTAALVSTTEAFKSYQERTKAIVSEDQYAAITAPENDHVINVQDMKGNEKNDIKSIKEKQDGDIVETISGDGRFGRFFDAASIYWKKSALDNRVFVQRQQDLAQQLLRSRGYLFLNQVYELLDIPATSAGSVYGWIWKDRKEPCPVVDFGLNDDRAKDFLEGLERDVYLKFNVQGIIYDQI